MFEILSPRPRDRSLVAARGSQTAIPAYAAWALIPDDDDEDLVEKAKAKRSQKLKEELGTQKKFARRSASGAGFAGSLSYTARFPCSTMRYVYAAGSC